MPVQCRRRLHRRSAWCAWMSTRPRSLSPAGTSASAASAGAGLNPRGGHEQKLVSKNDELTNYSSNFDEMFVEMLTKITQKFSFQTSAFENGLPKN